MKLNPAQMLDFSTQLMCKHNAVTGSNSRIGGVLVNTPDSTGSQQHIRGSRIKSFSLMLNPGVEAVFRFCQGKEQSVFQNRHIGKPFYLI